MDDKVSNKNRLFTLSSSCGCLGRSSIWFYYLKTFASDCCHCSTEVHATNISRRRANFFIERCEGKDIWVKVNLTLLSLVFFFLSFAQLNNSLRCERTRIYWVCSYRNRIGCNSNWRQFRCRRVRSNMRSVCLVNFSFNLNIGVFMFVRINHRSAIMKVCLVRLGAMKFPQSFPPADGEYQHIANGEFS